MPLITLFKKQFIYLKTALLFEIFILLRFKALLLILGLCFGLPFFISFDVFVNAVLPLIVILVTSALSNHEEYNIYTRLYSLPIPKIYFFLTKLFFSLMIYLTFLFLSLWLESPVNFNLNSVILSVLLIFTSALAATAIGFFTKNRLGLYLILIPLIIINLLPLLSVGRFININLFNQLWLTLKITTASSPYLSVDLNNMFYINGLTWLIFVIFITKSILNLKSR